MELAKESFGLYEQDFYLWIMKNVDSMREKKIDEIDFENIAEELESMGKSEKREIGNRLAVLLAHLLKWTYQPKKRSRSWRTTILKQREELSDLLEDSPSLRNQLNQQIEKSYSKAKLIAEIETKILKNNFPKDCPFTIKQILDSEFLPE